MKTTLDLDDDLVLIAKELAARRKGVPLFVPEKGARKPAWHS